MQPQNEVRQESMFSGVSWGAVLAGAFVAAALSLILLSLGAGLGFSGISPWTNEGASATTVGIASIVWLILMQIISGSLGAYIAGRLRTKWVNIHSEEVFFRDTAHGFLVWAVGLVLTAAFLISAVTSLVGAGVKAGATATGVAAGATAAGVSSAAATNAEGANSYLVDSLFRSEKADADVGASAVRTEVARIFTSNLGREFAPDDKAYLVQLVASRAGLSPEDADKRVTAIIAKVKTAEVEARQALDAARKAAAHASLWMFLSLLIGAFCASYAATIGGRQRDRFALPGNTPEDFRVPNNLKATGQS